MPKRPVMKKTQKQFKISLGKDLTLRNQLESAADLNNVSIAEEMRRRLILSFLYDTFDRNMIDSLKLLIAWLKHELAKPPGPEVEKWR